MAKTPKPAPPPRADLRKALVVRVDCAGAGADAALDAALRRLGELDEGTAAGGLKAGAVSAARVLVVTRDELTTLGNSLKAEKQGRSDKYVHSGSAKEVVLAAALQRRILLESDGGQTIFILRDYPSTVAEAAELLQRADSAGRSEPALDAVVTVVSSGSEGGGVTWPAPRRPCLAFDFSPLAQDLMPPGFEDAAKGKPKTPSTTLSTTEKQGADAAPPLVRTLFSAARKEKGAWADLTFSTCPVDALSKEEDYAETVLRNLRSALETLAGAKCAFKHWVAGLEAVPVPVEGKGVAKATAEAAAVVRANLGDYTEMPPWASHAVRADYAALASSVEAAWHSPGLLLYCAVEAVCARAEAAEASTPASPPLDRLRQRSRGLQRLGGAGFDVSRADLHTKSTKSGFPPAGGAALSAVVTVDHADSLGLRLARAELLREAGGLRLTAKDEDAPAPEAVSALVLALERAAFRQMQQPRVVGRGALPPGGATLPPEKRGVDSTELLAFAGFSGADMTDFAQRSMFDSLLRGAFVAQGVDGAAPSVFGRNYKDLLASHVMMQLLSAEMAHEPVVLQHYHAATDELLLVLHQPTARGRIGQALWDPSLIFGSRPTFANWSHGRGSSAAAGLDALTPRSAAAHGSTVDIYADKLAVLATATTLLFPADHSVMKLRTMGPSAAWLTVRKDDVTFGLRAADGGRLAAARAQGDKVDLPKKGAVGFGADFVCDFGTARCVVHKLEKGEGVCLQTTDPSGLTLDVSTDGMVRMRRVELGGHGEVERVVLGKGTVVIRHKSGAKTLLFADGSSATQGKPGSDLVWRRLKLESIDAATQARISRPESGNGSLVRFHDGATLARHFDGTEMRCDAKREKVLVRAPGFAAVEISMAIDATARAHASGNAVAIKKGGARIRLRVSAHDGTRILATYDTSVTATIRSRLSLLRPDCAEVVCADDGSGQFRPAELWAGGALKVQGETSRSVYGAAPPAFKDETDCGAYDFDCKAGLLRTEDPEFNRFAAYLCGPRAGDVELELAGVAAGLRCEAVVNAPREARCLVVKRDGSGSELLRPADVARLRREAGYAGDSPYVGRAEVAEGGALDDTLNATLSATLASTGLGATGTPGKRRATMKADDSEDLASKPLPASVSKAVVVQSRSTPRFPRHGRRFQFPSSRRLEMASLFPESALGTVLTRPTVAFR
ncbi:hypothetical protein M885DRAFT_310116 [Pelagophyceae sp. CCMP2097]|nr:hypothetical protein M885DRAFT_310116 [Pelagophyceae sp. CCMP2097]